MSCLPVSDALICFVTGCSLCNESQLSNSLETSRLSGQSCNGVNIINKNIMLINY